VPATTTPLASKLPPTPANTAAWVIDTNSSDAAVWPGTAADASIVDLVTRKLPQSQTTPATDSDTDPDTASWSVDFTAFRLVDGVSPVHEIRDGATPFSSPPAAFDTSATLWPENCTVLPRPTSSTVPSVADIAVHDRVSPTATAAFSTASSNVAEPT